jgi:hypothetical protein
LGGAARGNEERWGGQVSIEEEQQKLLEMSQNVAQMIESGQQTRQN